MSKYDPEYPNYKDKTKQWVDKVVNNALKCEKKIVISEKPLVLIEYETEGINQDVYIYWLGLLDTLKTMIIFEFNNREQLQQNYKGTYELLLEAIEKGKELVSLAYINEVEEYLKTKIN